MIGVVCYIYVGRHSGVYIRFTASRTVWDQHPLWSKQSFIFYLEHSVDKCI